MTLLFICRCAARIADRAVSQSSRSRRLRIARVMPFPAAGFPHDLAGSELCLSDRHRLATLSADEQARYGKQG